MSETRPGFDLQRAVIDLFQVANEVLLPEVELIDPSLEWRRVETMRAQAQRLKGYILDGEPEYVKQSFPYGYVDFAYHEEPERTFDYLKMWAFLIYERIDTWFMMKLYRVWSWGRSGGSRRLYKLLYPRMREVRHVVRGGGTIERDVLVARRICPHAPLHVMDTDKQRGHIEFLVGRDSAETSRA